MPNFDATDCSFCKTYVPDGATVCTGCGAHRHYRTPSAWVKLGIVLVGLYAATFLGSALTLGLSSLHHHFATKPNAVIETIATVINILTMISCVYVIYRFIRSYENAVQKECRWSRYQ